MNRDQYIRRWEMYKHRQLAIPGMTPGLPLRITEFSCETGAGHAPLAKWDPSYGSAGRMHGNRFS